MELVDHQKVYNKLYERYKNMSMCLNKDKFEKLERFGFICNHFSDTEMCCLRLTDPPMYPIHVFRIKNKQLYGSLFDYIRFKYTINEIKKFIKEADKLYETRLKNNRLYEDIINLKVIADISKEEIKMMQNNFHIKLKMYNMYI